LLHLLLPAILLGRHLLVLLLFPTLSLRAAQAAALAASDSRVPLLPLGQAEQQMLGASST